MLEKYALCFTSRDYDEKVLSTLSLKAAARAREVGYERAAAMRIPPPGATAGQAAT